MRLGCGSVVDRACMEARRQMARRQEKEATTFVVSEVIECIVMTMWYLDMENGCQ